MKKVLTNKKVECLKVQEQFQIKSNHISNIRLILFILFLANMILAIVFKKFLGIGIVLAIIFLVLFIIFVLYHLNITKKINQQKDYLKIILEYEKRYTDKWKDFKNDGYEYLNINPNLFLDLDLVGKNSLFQLISVSKSIGGNYKLASSFNEFPTDLKKLQDKQECVKELVDNFDFSLKFQQILNNYNNIEKTNYHDYVEQLKSLDKISIIKFIINIILNVLTIVCFVLGCLSIISTIFFYISFLLAFFYSYYVVFSYKEYFDSISKSAAKLGNLNQVISLVIKTDFKNKKLNDLKNAITKSQKAIINLAKLSSLDSLRSNFISSLFLNALNPFNHLIIFLYQKNIDKESIMHLNKAADVIEEFEMLLSLTTIAMIKDDVCLPKYTNKISLETVNLKHPLLLQEKCIANDFKTNDDINIITGSNMSGKSSFMKTIAINLILANIGSYVNATSFSFTFLKMFSSIKIVDDISNNISTFYGELLRIKKIIDYQKANDFPLIIFIDEIFKGTNYNDRIFGASQVIKLLSNVSSIVFLTTHDFELCRIDNKLIKNYHFSETYQDNQIYFDYKIKEGPCNSTNARYLMQTIGLIK